MPSADQIFGWAGQAAMLGWVVLLLLPRRWPWLLAVPRYLIPFGLSLVYAGLAMTHFFTIEGGGYGSLAEVSVLLSKEEMLLAGWIHYLAFDLFIGGWIATEADRLGLSRVLQAPLLVATFMFGPVGLALFLAMRSGYRRVQTVPQMAAPV
ncbi:MAG: ABA4-like family protein [Pseudomonadota bacterium]